MVASDPGGLRAETEVFLTVKNINDNKEGMKEIYFFFLSSGHDLEIIFKKSANKYIKINTLRKHAYAYFGSTINRASKVKSFICEHFQYQISYQSQKLSLRRKSE